MIMSKNRKGGAASAVPAFPPVDVPDDIATDVFARVVAKSEVVTLNADVVRFDARVLDWLEGVWKARKRVSKRGTKVDPPKGVRVERADGGYVLVTLVAPEDSLELDDVLLRALLVKQYGTVVGNRHADALYSTRTVTEFNQDSLRAAQDAGIVTDKMINDASTWQAKTHYPKYTSHLPEATDDTAPASEA